MSPRRCINPLPLTDNLRIDSERLAALLDGRLGDAEAAALREQLADADDDTLSAYADAVAISAELGAETPGVVSIEAARRKRHWRTPAFAAAAAVAAVAVFMFRPSNRTDEFLPQTYAAAIPSGTRAMDGPVWGVTRGAGAGISDRARAARVGALLTDIEVGARHGDTSRTATLALATLIEDVPTGVAISVLLRGESADPALKRQTMALVDRAQANAGAYLEAARIATAAGDITFFDRAPADVLRGLGHDDVITLIRASPRDAARIHAAVVDALRSMTQ